MSHSNLNVLVEGYCDAHDNNTYNVVLGEKRCQTVKTFMIDCAIDEFRISVISLGESDQVYSGETEEELV